jgi:hypothetical protein
MLRRQLERADLYMSQVGWAWGLGWGCWGWGFGVEA